MTAAQIALRVARRDPDAWLEYTEQAVAEKKLWDPSDTVYHNTRKGYRFREVAGDETTKKINRLVIEEVIHRTNHLLDYLDASTKRNRPVPKDCLTVLEKHRTFLDRWEIPRYRGRYRL